MRISEKFESPSKLSSCKHMPDGGASYSGSEVIGTQYLQWPLQPPDSTVSCRALLSKDSVMPLVG